MAEEPKPVNEDDLKQLKERMELIVNADPAQYHNDFSLRRYLRAFKTVDATFQAILKTNKWRVEYGVADLHKDVELLEKYKDKARVLRHRDIIGRPIIYIPTKNYNSSERDIDELTKFIVYCLEDASKKCFEEVVDNLCIVFDLNNFTLSCMDYQVLKNLIWLLSRHYPERLGVCLIVNAPTFFSGCWAVIKGWLDENTAGKVTFVNSEMDLSLKYEPLVIMGHGTRLAILLARDKTPPPLVETQLQMVGHVEVLLKANYNKHFIIS